MLNKENIICLLKEAAFDINEYWVTSGAAMVLYGIKDMTRDIDLGCTSQMADKLENKGYYVLSANAHVKVENSYKSCYTFSLINLWRKIKNI